MEKIVRVERIYSVGAEYKYELLCEEANEKRVGAPPRYSIRITMQVLSEITEAATDFIFNSLEDACSFYELLTKNLATPKNLEYVVADELLFS